MEMIGMQMRLQALGIADTNCDGWISLEEAKGKRCILSNLPPGVVGERVQIVPEAVVEGDPRDGDDLRSRAHGAPQHLRRHPFARRVARNTQLVLLEESNLARVGDPAAGSGALEAMTHALCTAAWAAFREIEQQGGAWAALETGLIQRHAAAVRAERERAVARRTDILTGTNEYPNIDEVLPAVLDVAPAALPNDDAPVTAAALPRIRLAEPFEQLRDTSDKILAQTGARPKVFLATLGKPADFNARANFAKNFFEAGGIEAVGDCGAPSPLAAAFKASGAALACLCGSDKTYDSEAEAAAAALKAAGARRVYLTGRPGAKEEPWRTAGVQTFVYEGCDVLATLQAAYDILR